MTSHNASGGEEEGGEEVPPGLSVNGFPLLWLPYVAIVLVFVVFLAANFCLYHRKVRERYQRKKEELAMQRGVYAKRRIVSLMRADFHPELPPDPSTAATSPTATSSGSGSREEGGGGGKKAREGTPSALFVAPHYSGHRPPTLAPVGGPSPSTHRLAPFGEDEIVVDAVEPPTQPPAQPPATPPPKHHGSGRRHKKKRRGAGKFQGTEEPTGEAGGRGGVEEGVSTPGGAGGGAPLRWRDGVDSDVPLPKRPKHQFGGNLIMSSMMNSLQSSLTSRSHSD